MTPGIASSDVRFTFKYHPFGSGPNVNSDCGGNRVPLYRSKDEQRTVTPQTAPSPCFSSLGGHNGKHLGSGRSRKHRGLEYQKHESDRRMHNILRSKHLVKTWLSRSG
jgi:hypothetical protein